MISLQAYKLEDRFLWDELVKNSRNGNFLHLRSYMDYHADRFHDTSLIIFRHGKPVGVFPASIHEDEIRSHGGLTYGGVICNESVGAEDMLSIFAALRDHYAEAGVKNILYKSIPAAFHRYPCEEDLYALFRMGARLIRRDASSAIALNGKFAYTKGRKWSINKAKKAGIHLSRATSLEGFYALLSSALLKFGATPTHTLSELQLLAARFPENIVLYQAALDTEVAAGAVVYDFGHIVHTQYLATSARGREAGALDYLIADLIERVYAGRKFFSFGISTEQQGWVLNTGLIAQKEGFGARTIVHDFYEWKIA